MQASFLTIGECMVEMSEAGEGLFRRGFAGDTFNTAWYARRVLPPDCQVSFGSAIGRDALSQEMATFIAGEGIDTAALRRVAGRTVGLYMIRLDGGERRFAYWRGQSAARRLADDAGWLDRVLSGRRVIHFSGITLAILTPRARARLIAALARARGAGARIAFDTNLRPHLWEGPGAMRQAVMAGAGVADVVLPSFDEEAVAFGDATPEQTVARYQGAGARLVAVKNGAGALTLWDAAGTRQVAAVPVARVVDTTAAGDSFGACFLARLAQGAAPDDAARAAMALAAQVIGHRGALAPVAMDDLTF